VSRRAQPTIAGASVARWVGGLLPTAAGGPPPAFAAIRARVSTWLLATFALGGGAAVGLALVLVGTAMPNVPASLTGLGVGVLVGAGVALAFGSRFPLVRRYGAIAVLLAPLLVFVAPVFLIVTAIPLLWRRRGELAVVPEVEPEAAIVVAKPRRRRSGRRKAR